MKRSITAITLVLLCSVASWGQNIASVANGLYYMPTTWDCFCIPNQTMNITINHQVTLNNNLGLVAGSITINASGALVQDAVPRSMLMTGGTFSNSGTFSMDRMAVQGGTFSNQGNAQIRAYSNEVTFMNTGTISGTDTLFNMGDYTNSGDLVHAVIYTGQSFTNQGTVTGVDSLYNAGTLTNGPSALMEVDSLYNAGELTNDGTMDHVAFTNAGTYTNHGLVLFNDMINLAGVFHNHGSLTGTGSMTNAEDFFNHPDGTVTLAVSFLNAPLTVPPSPAAIFTNDGTVTIGDSWYNFDLVTGDTTGYWSVQDSSVNVGSMTGTFQFCDLTPLQLGFPVVDYNVGTVAPTVRFCQLMTFVGVKEKDPLRVFPNPTTDLVTVQLPAVSGTSIVIISDMADKQVIVPAVRTSGSERLTIDLSGLVQGTYLLELRAEGERYRTLVVKQ
ncbi:MAG: T9SS type A sorting domain-containing protein [Flavobacteriales bacterium]|nr:T9SS type A sorting domain-containing protein [Flavobacteriales bacterium]